MLKGWFGKRNSLYERIGGDEAMDEMVDIFYRKVLDDEHVRRFFEDVDMDQQRVKQKRFLAWVCGGPYNYTGDGIRRAHSHLLQWGLDDSHFDHVVEHLKASLEALNVATEDRDEVLGKAGSLRHDVLGR